MTNDSDQQSWAPRSPDLTAVYQQDQQPVHPQHQGYRGSISHSLPQYLTRPPQSPTDLTLSPITLTTPITPSSTMPRGVKKEVVMQDADFVPEPAPTVTEKGRGKRAAPSNNNGFANTEEQANVPAGTPEAVVIKNHFPVARIKRIMQADDDVGKVAQVTPVVVSKALELFMISLVTKAATQAKTRNSKRVAPAHLKQVVKENEQFDFLSEIVSKVADAPAPAEKSDTMDVDGKKPRKAPARKKKKVEEEEY